VIHHRIPLKRNIYGEFIHPNRGLSNIEPFQKEGYRRPTLSEATEYFKIQNRSIVSSWWADKKLILGGGILKAHPPKWPALEDELLKLFTAARADGKIVTVHWFR
jgi:hypothetical protein